MNYRNSGSGIGSVSEVGLGCWQLGGADWGEVSESDALAILGAGYANGITFFDTADVYGLGRSEELIGKFLKQSRPDVTVGTKLGRMPDPGWPANFEEAALRSHTEGSLRRLGVEALDLTQLHCIPTEVLKRGDVFESLRRLQQEGKIKRFGVSVESMEEALICLDQPGVVSLQIIFNIFRQKPIEALFERARSQGVALIVRLPLASGLLAGKYSPDTVFPAQDHRNYNRDGAAFNVGETFAGLPFAKGVELVEKIRPLVPADLTMSQFAIRWCLDFEAVTTVIPGAKGPDMAAANATVSALPPLSAVLHATLRQLYEDSVERHIRGPY